jgi:transposase
VPKKIYDQEFKREVLAYMASTRESQEAVASRFGIPANTLRYWQRRAEAPLGAPQPGVAREDPQAELRRLRRENQRLQQQCEILKKTVGIFSNPSGSASGPSER